MNRCDLFEREGLLQLARGVALDPHFDRCADCVEARRVYERLTSTLAGLDQNEEPSPAWQAGVWSRIAGERTPPARHLRRWLIPGAALAAAAALFALWIGRAPETLSLTTEVQRGQSLLRGGTEAHRGDQLHVNARIGTPVHAELRVYLNGTELKATCTASASCVRQGKLISLTTLMDAAGTYRAVVIVSRGPIPPSVGTLDRDAAAVLAAGGQIQAGEPIAVR